jgi:uncharacterized protein DUF1553/uncharacterized protein DUF1549/concanavalin A-like lectin/glucanase superfamily protein
MLGITLAHGCVVERRPVVRSGSTRNIVLLALACLPIGLIVGAEPASHADNHSTISEKRRQFWSFVPVRPVAPPIVRDGSWPKSAIDRFILAGLEAKGLRPAAPADKLTLLRRATFDLIGLPPTQADIDAFLADDSPQAFAKVVDRLLASPSYGERWGRHWLDEVRYADARDLIQLPPESDFRESWRYRDWVVQSFNRDLPYTDFVRYQIAGDLLPAPKASGINKDALVATGMLAIADFVPGDVDKDGMIADYVNDEIDVVSRAFLGLTIACARCHDHKFDPISTEDYYALAGIFFSTRLIPGPVPGNTPLIRLPLASPAELAKDAAVKKRRADLELQLRDAVDREYLANLNRLVTEQTARYLVAACEFRKQAPGVAKASVSEAAKKHQLQESLLAAWVDYVDRVAKRPTASQTSILHDATVGKLVGSNLEVAAKELQDALIARAATRESEPPSKRAISQSSVMRFRADDSQLVTDAASHVLVWPNRASQIADARPSSPTAGPLKVGIAINGNEKTVLRFNGQSSLEAPGSTPPAGSLFVVYRTADNGNAGNRLIGWEDSDVGKHGLGLMLAADGRLHAVLRKNGQSGDIVSEDKATGFEIVGLSWGPDGTALYRNGTSSGKQHGITSLSSDPAISSLHIGGPGSGSAPRFRGDIAEIRVYDRPLSDAERQVVESELRESWFKQSAPMTASFQDQVADLYDELVSSRGPFWVPAGERMKLLAPEVRTRLATLNHELEVLKKMPPLKVEQAVAVQDGGPKGTRFEGFKDANVFVRGNHKQLGKIVPRGFPRVLAGERQERITSGSGRLQLADWIARDDNPLTARVMVNRIWQHHFGEGLVRTPSNFGERGERPSNPELLDFLAARFVESGWSVKAMHRLIMLSSAYQQSSRTNAKCLAADPDNRLFGRMNRRPLEAEAIRDSLLAAAGRLDLTQGGPAYADLAAPRRTLYLMSARTGANTSDFGRLFDRADPCSIVDQRGQSVVAPQALFFLNDPTVSIWARDLAARVLREAPAGNDGRIRRLYRLVLGREPTKKEIDVGLKLIAPTPDIDPWERYCLLVVCTNEFVYVD